MRKIGFATILLTAFLLAGCGQEEVASADGGTGASTKDGKGAAGSSNQQLTLNPNYKGN